MSVIVQSSVRSVVLSKRVVRSADNFLGNRDHEVSWYYRGGDRGKTKEVRHGVR